MAKDPGRNAREAAPAYVLTGGRLHSGRREAP